MARGWRGGGGVKCERVETMFYQEFTPIGPHPNLILFNTLHCYKNPFTLLEIPIGQDKYTAGPHSSYSSKTFIKGHESAFRGRENDFRGRESACKESRVTLEAVSILEI